MAAVIQLKRSSSSGASPTTSDLSLGELAINTYDGRVFLEKNDGSASIMLDPILQLLVSIRHTHSQHPMVRQTKF